ncbi:hypothetical protein VKX94_02025 [Lactobacillus helveticus]|uniref:Uncharacterized protein n=1 Tax=Lactobacillus helveticus CIRM-BIA 951 TaxID=1226334 RepID=U6F6J7_LACHE|nr:hypothetical protein [Lactobacillus helveticus]MDY0990901.1 hypothetical protein [Lactobacillus helveticus]MDY1001600.1 hypothetical protein [Lactobacillus helveticus]MEB2873422.1 hypothetical protein [Lactobacillus helveticus]CDI58599.1 Predicted protein [Lactobacillus helveticus CIRM-BIA 951]
MSLIRLDGFKDYSNEREIKLPGIDKTWKVKFDDQYRVQSGLIASEVDKLYREQSSSNYEDELLKLTQAERKKRLTADLNKFKKTCVDGLSTLLQDDKAGEEIYEAKGDSTEICAQIIGKLNDICEKVLDVTKQKEEDGKASKYDTER